HAHLAGALESLGAYGDAAGAIALALSIWLFWELRGFLKEGQVWTERVIGLPDAKKQREFGWLLNVAGDFHRLQGDFPSARELKERSLALVRQAGEKWQLAVVLHNLGVVAAAEGGYEEAAALYDECMRISWELGALGVFAECLDGLADVAYAIGDLVSATRLWAASGQLFIETAERPWNPDEANAGIDAARSGLGQELFEI